MSPSERPSTLKAELRHLRAFVAVAHSGSVSRAAEQVGLTQSRVSQQLRELEEALDTALFARVGRRLALTAAGRRFYTDAAEILDRIDLAVRTLTDVDDIHLRVGVVPACTSRFIPAIFGILARRHPRFTLTVDELSADEIERNIESGRLDLGLGFLPHGSPSLDYKPLLHEKFRLILREDHPLASSKSLRMSALRDVAFALLPKRYYMRQLIDQQMARHGVRPRIQFELSSVPALIRTVQEAGAATLLPPFTVPPSRDVVDVELHGRNPIVEVGVMQARTDGLNVAVERFVAAAEEVIRTTIRRGGEE